MSSCSGAGNEGGGMFCTPHASHFTMHNDISCLLLFDIQAPRPNLCRSTPEQVPGPHRLEPAHFSLNEAPHYISTLLLKPFFHWGCSAHFIQFKYHFKRETEWEGETWGEVKHVTFYQLSTRKALATLQQCYPSLEAVLALLKEITAIQQEMSFYSFRSCGWTPRLTVLVSWPLLYSISLA